MFAETFVDRYGTDDFTYAYKKVDHKKYIES